MSLYDWLLFLHIATAFALVSALVLFTFLIVGGRSLSVPSDVVRMFRISKVGDALMGIGSIGVLVFGIWLAIEVEGTSSGTAGSSPRSSSGSASAPSARGSGRSTTPRATAPKALVAEGRDEPNPELNAMLRSPTGLMLHMPRSRSRSCSSST